MAVNGALVAVLVGALGGAAYLYATKKPAEKRGTSPCEKACYAALKISGVPGDSTSSCSQYCGVLDGLGGPVGVVKKAISAIPVVAAYNALTKNDVCTKCCPAGSEAVVLVGKYAGKTVKELMQGNLIKSTKDISAGLINDQRTGARSSGIGCRDKTTKKLVGYLPPGGGFVAWAPSTGIPVAVTPVPQPGTSFTSTSSHGAAGGVTVT